MFRVMLCPKGSAPRSSFLPLCLEAGDGMGNDTHCVPIECQVGRSCCCFICDPQSIGKNVFFIAVPRVVNDPVPTPNLSPCLLLMPPTNSGSLLRFREATHQQDWNRNLSGA